jgi:hypothetical protein
LKLVHFEPKIIGTKVVMRLYLKKKRKTFLLLRLRVLNINKKSLKIPKGQSEYVYRRRTDNTMAKRKSTKGQTTINKTYI